MRSRIRIIIQDGVELMRLERYRYSLTCKFRVQTVKSLQKISR
jgi:hypothetical protein